ncbi:MULTISPECIES: hypothetical protein [unclassified Microcoleus]|nr:MULTISPECIES: hypothetical protein [unclassified Microcoleus]
MSRTICDRRYFWVGWQLSVGSYPILVKSQGIPDDRKCILVV